MEFTAAVEIYSQIKSILDSAINDLQIEELAAKMIRWEDFADFFELTEAEREEIRRNSERDYRAQKRAALRAWKDKHGRKATLSKFLLEAQQVSERLTLEAESSNVLESFRHFLIECYAVAHHPSQSSWPFSHEEAYVNLPLFEAPAIPEEPPAIPGSQPNVQLPKLVELNDIFQAGNRKAKRKIILLEGVAGCGKTTLAWHAYQKWAEGKLFRSFPLFIYVSLEDPSIRSASCLADIIPHPIREMREAVAKVIAERHGKGVCFFLDGWDELATCAKKRGSFLYRLIEGKPGRSMLSHSSIIVTSRPASSGSLYPLLSSRIIVGRLDKRRIDDLLSACLLPEESDELLKILDHHSQLANLCNLPINAMVVIHLFRSGVRTFPSTRTQLFKALLCNLLLRHIQLRTEHDERELGECFEFGQLPIGIREKFTALCSLAFNGIMEECKVFGMDSLKSLGLGFSSDTLSLVEAHLTTFGFVRSFAFLHYSVQEFLAAWHMSRLDSKKQAKAVSHILDSTPLSPVLPFFAGLTGLSNSDVRDILLDVTKYPLDEFSIFANKPRDESHDRRRLALALLNCIYESQNCTLCKCIVPPNTTVSPLPSTNMSFTLLSLEPIDCVSIGFFLANHCSCAMDLNCCSVGDAGLEGLINQLKQSAERVFHRMLNLNGNPLTCTGMKLVNEVLRTPLLSQISLLQGWQSSQVTRNLKYLIEGLSRSTCTQIALPETITSKHAHYLVLLIATSRLRVLDLVWSDIKEGLPLVAEALYLNTSIKEIDFTSCNLGDDGLLQLGLKTRTSITFIGVTDRSITSSAVKVFLRRHFFSSLEKLNIGRSLNDEEMMVYEQLQLSRTQTNLPPLSVFDLTSPLQSSVFKMISTYLSLPEHVQKRVTK